MTKSLKKPATMSDVAKEAGVSLKTVSRVFNNEKYVTEDKKARILEAAKTLNFQPAVAARGLAGGRSFMIGLFVDDASGDYVAKMMRGLVNACDATGTHLVVEVIRDLDDVSKVQRAVASVRFDGVILPPPLCDAPALLAFLRENGVPVARIGAGQALEDFASVYIDEELAAYKMTDYLIAKGHKKIGFIIGDPEHACSALRETGYRRAMAAAGLTVEDRFLAQGYFNFPSGRDAAQTLMQGAPDLTAVFASNDEMAAGAVDYLSNAGVRVPDDLSVVGFDDDIAASMMSPTLTTVRQPIEDMARQAHALICNPGDYQKIQHRFSVDIVERQSVRAV